MTGGSQESGTTRDARVEVKVIKGLRQGRVIRFLKSLEMKAGASSGKKLNTLKGEKQDLMMKIHSPAA